MTNVFQLKPKSVLLIFFSLFIVSFFISVVAFELLNPIINFAGLSVLGLGFIIPFIIWIIYVGSAIEKKDRAKIIPADLNYLFSLSFCLPFV